MKQQQQLERINLSLSSIRTCCKILCDDSIDLDVLRKELAAVLRNVENNLLAIRGQK